MNYKKLKAKSKFAELNLTLKIECEECNSTSFKFQRIKDNSKNNETLDSPYADDEYGVLGVTCNKCGYGYSFNLKLDNIEKKSIFN